MDEVKYKETLNNLKKTWQYARKNKKPLYIYLILSVLLSIISSVIPIVSAKVLLSLTGYQFRQLIIIATIVFIIEICRNIFRYFASRMSQIFFRETLVDIQLSIARETIQLESRAIDKNSSGTFIDRLNKDSNEIADIFNWINQFFSDFLSNIGILIAVFIISQQVFIYFLVGLIVLFVLKKIRTQKFFARDKKFRELSEKNTGIITELIRGIKDIKLLNANTIFTEKIALKLQKSNEERYQMTSIARKYDLVTGSIEDLMSLLFIFLGIWLVTASLLTIPSFVILYMYQSKVYNLLYTTAWLLEITKKFNLAAGRVFEITDGQVYKKEKFGPTKLDKIVGNFEFKNVSFAYDEEMPVLNDLSFKIKANETVGFVGKSGSGKTTIFSLLTKLYDVNKGEILIDGININELDCDSIRGNISIITQNPYIFNFSIKENLNVVKKDLTEEEMIEACQTACIHDYIMTLPERYDTVVGEGGLTLSGGQRQRLAIARALIKKTEIILFDEATSALDNETQKQIQQAIVNMKNKYTILIIAHRLSTVINSDRIIVIDKGSVIASGKHQELLKKSAVYKKLYETDLVINGDKEVTEKISKIIKAAKK